jgi:hypothetical protein
MKVPHVGSSDSRQRSEDNTGASDVNPLFPTEKENVANFGGERPRPAGLQQEPITSRFARLLSD